jgi:hypothetical protein
MDKLRSIIRAAAGAQLRGQARGPRVPRRAAVVGAARNLVHTKGAIAFMTPEKSVAWADLQAAIDALEGSGR